MNRPLLAVTICFALGIMFNSLFAVGTGIVFAAVLTACCMALAAYVLHRREGAAAILLLFVLLGWFWAGAGRHADGRGPEQFAGHYVTLEGTVDSEPRYGSGGNDAVYVLAAKAVYLGDRRVETSGLVQVQVKGGGPVYSYGEQLRADGFVYRPREPGNFGAFNYRDYLERRGIHCLMTVRGPEQIRIVTGEGGRVSLVGLALEYKNALRSVADATLNQRQTAVLGGLLFGSRDRIDRATNDIFAETGVAHVLCVSGLHVGFVVAGVFLVAGALGVPRRFYLLILVPVLTFYAVMTGLGPAVFRACVMAVLVLAAALLGRERDWPTALALAAGALLLINPLYIHELGFQLSFAATWGILYLGPPLGELFRIRFSLPHWLAIPLQVTIAAQLATMPLLVYHFNLIPFIAPLANLLLVPLVGVIMLAGFTGSVTGLVFQPAAELINAGTGALIDLFIALAGLLNAIPGGAVYVATPPWPAVPLWFAGLVLVAETVRGRVNLPGIKRGKTGPAVAGVLLMLVIVWPWNGTGGRMQVHFLDVGQGDSILVRFPGGKTMLVDTGGRQGEPDEARVTGDAVVVPYLHHLGINRINALVITHPHEDHAGGVPAVLEKLKVDAMVITDAPGYDEIVALAESVRVPVYRAGTGQALQLDDRVNVLVLAPGRGDDAVHGLSVNDASLVLRLDYRDSSFLLTGDIEEQAQRQLLAGGADLKSDVFKVPHHGSRFYEPGFYQEVAPDLAVIQVGENNRFGHPAAGAVETLMSSNAMVLRTDRDGAVLISTEGENFKVQTAKTP